MNYKIAICDDSSVDREYLATLAKQWAMRSGHTIRLLEFPSSESFLFHYAQENDFDILLLDVEMGAMDGVSLAKRLRRTNETIQIIFVTGYSDYIAEGYEVAALHYLMKPVHADKLFAVLSRASEKLSKNERVLNLTAEGGLVRVPLHQLRYAQVHLNYVTIYAKEEFTVKMTLGELLKSLDDRFYRVGRSCIVNLTMIRRVTKTAIYLSDGTALPLPRGAYDGINRAIIQMN